MKRFTIFAVLLGFIVVSLLIARPALTDQQSEKKTSEPTKLEELQKERIEVFEKMIPFFVQQYGSNDVRFTDFSKAQEGLIEAKLEATDKPDERIALLEEQLKIAKQAFHIAEVKFTSGNKTAAESLQAKAHCLTIEIKLIKEQKKSRTTADTTIPPHLPPRERPLISLVLSRSCTFQCETTEEGFKAFPVIHLLIQGGRRGLR